MLVVEPELREIWQKKLQGIIGRSAEAVMVREAASTYLQA